MTRGDRYLTAREFGTLLSDLKLTDNIFQDNLLQFLERQQILLPAARIRLPDSIVFDNRRERAEKRATPEEIAKSEALSRAFSLWERSDDPEISHPLDQPETIWADLLTKQFPPDKYVRWLDMRPQISDVGEPLLYSGDGFETYYHRWQAMLVADILEMGAKLVFDTTQSELREIAHDRRFQDLPKGSCLTSISIEAPRGLKGGRQWSAFFDAAARLETLRNRRLESISVGLPDQSGNLDGDKLTEFNEAMKVSAQAELAVINGEEADLFKLLKYLSERWVRWQQRGRPKIEQEYKHQIFLTVSTLIYLQNSDFDKIPAQLGRVTNHFKNTLDVIFPDWIEGARQSLDLSLKHSVVKQAPSAEPRLALTENDVTDFIAWLERNDFIKIHASISAIIDHQFRNSNEDRAVMIKEAEAISSAFEQIVGALLADAQIKLTDGEASSGLKKLNKLWQAFPDIAGALNANSGLTRTSAKATRSDQLAAIASINSNGKNIGVIKYLLSTILYRNDGVAHQGMRDWSESELREASITSLTAMMFCRKCLLVMPPP